VGLSVYFPIVAGQRFGKDVSAATKNCWRRRFPCGSCRLVILFNDAVSISCYIASNSRIINEC
jgi:hypothetical protein